MSALDREAAREVLIDILGRQIGVDPQLVGTYADRFLALVRPVDGVVLTREEAQLAAYGLRHIGDGTAWRKPEHAALAQRLEAAS